LKALVTGASSGFGKLFSYELARKGYDLVIVARRKERLDKIAKDILKQYKVNVEVFQADLAEYASLQKLVENYSDIDLLVNNAGFGIVGKFIDIELEHELKMIDLNIKALYFLTKKYAKTMLGKKNAGIINVASTAAFQPLPGFTTYAASKAFVLSFTEALNYEFKGAIRIMVLCPGPAKTEFFNQAGVSKMKLKEMDPEKVVKAALHAFEKGRRIYIPGMANRFIVFIQRFVSNTVVMKFAAKLFYNESKHSLNLQKEER